MTTPLGKELRKARTKAKLTQTQLADLADLVQDQISSYELGKTEPTLDTFSRLNAVLGPLTHRPERGRRGRPSILDDRLILQFVKLMSDGNYIEVACDYLGVNRSQVQDWTKRGQSIDEDYRADPEMELVEEDRLYRQFYLSTTRARAEAEQGAVSRLRRAAEDGDVESDKWFLERSFHGRWGRRRQIEATIDLGGGVELQFDLPKPRVIGEEPDDLDPE